MGPSTTPEDDSPGVRLMTMQGAKGLEFRAICVIGADSQNIPPGWLIPDDEVDARQVRQQERCLLYVACSQARERLAVSWTGEPSPFLSGIVNDPQPQPTGSSPRAKSDGPRPGAVSDSSVQPISAASAGSNRDSA
jgi:superfamily I DNA/RNA helicase